MKTKVEGLKGINDALMEMRQPAAKALLTRVLKKNAALFAETYRAGVTRRTGQLQDHIGVGTRLSRRQRKVTKKESDVEVYAGASRVTQATTEEFGTSNQAPNPQGRMAWDATKNEMLDGVVRDLRTEVDKAAKRAARKAEKWKKP